VRVPSSRSIAKFSGKNVPDLFFAASDLPPDHFCGPFRPEWSFLNQYPSSMTSAIEILFSALWASTLRVEGCELAFLETGATALRGKNNTQK